MIFLSLLAKTIALALVPWHPWLALALWLAGAAADVRVAWRADGTGLGWSKAWHLAWLHGAALVVGWAAAGACDSAAMRWKDGIPLFADLVAGGVRLLGVEAGARSGAVCLTTMAGPLEFAASLDAMALKVPALFLVLAAVWMGWSGTPVVEALRRCAIVLGILLVVAVVRMGCILLLANGLFDFVGYETEELPYRPFMDEAAGVWAYLPLLLVAGVGLGLFLPEPTFMTPQAPGGRRWLGWAAVPVALALAGIACWEPAGTPKHGRVVISTYHSGWSTCTRPYDREWYGADSGYNYACLKRLFEAFYPVAIAPGPLTAADLEQASALVIYDPDQRFSPEEIGLVREFVRGGGGLLVIGDHTNVFGSTAHLNELCEPFGFQFRDDVLFDLDEDWHQIIDAPCQAAGLWHGMAFFKLRGPTSIRPTALATRPVYQVGHSKSLRAIYSVNNFYPPPHDDPRMKTGTFCVAATSRYGGGRVAAWADSTVFSNFEIFYPGKYEYLLNTLQWLSHRDGQLAALGRRVAALLLVGAVVVFLLVRRSPRAWLAAVVVLAGALGVARWASGVAERARARFPVSVQPSDWVFFAADPQDKGHHLRDFITEEPYDQRYEVFIQWVLRTGAFSAYSLLDSGRGNGLYEHLQTAANARTARALIVRKPGDLEQVGALGAIPARADDPVLLLFASTVPAGQAVDAIRQAGIVESADGLAQARSAWPNGEAMVEEGGRRVLVVAGAERFSDLAMGISEKVVPNAAQRTLFGQAFGLIDRLFGRTATGK